MSIYRSIVVLVKFKTIKQNKEPSHWNSLKSTLRLMEQLLETSELQTRLCHVLVIKMKFKNQSSL